MKSSFEIKPHGFKGERHVVLPPPVIREAVRHPLLGGLLPTAVGHFPHAAGHMVVRTRGLSEHILMLCVGGSGWCRFGHRTWRVGRDQIVVIPAGQAHSYGTTKRDPWSIYWTHFTGAETTAQLRALGITPDRPLLGVQSAGEVACHFESMLARLQYGYSTAILWNLSATLRLVFSLLNLLQQPVSSARRHGAAAIDHTVEFMRQNLTRPLMVAELARVAGLSPTHYTELFRRRTGYPPMAYFLRLRVQAASQALATTDEKIQDIARRFGFEDPYYFSRLFKKITGLPPAVHRQRHRRR